MSYFLFSPLGFFKETSKECIVLKLVMGFSSSRFSHTRTQETITKYTVSISPSFPIGFNGVFNGISTYSPHIFPTWFLEELNILCRISNFSPQWFLEEIPKT